MFSGQSAIPAVVNTPIFTQAQAVKIGSDKGSGADRDLNIYGPPTGYIPLGHQNHGGTIWAVKLERFQMMPKGPRSPVKIQAAYQKVWVHRREGRIYAVWQPVPQPGYVPVGVLLTFGGRGCQPPNYNTMCVRADLADQVGKGRRVWTDKGTGARHDLALGQFQNGLMCVNKSTDPSFHNGGNFVPRPTVQAAAVQPGPVRPGVALYQNAMTGGAMGGRMGPRPMARRPVQVAANHTPAWYAAHPDYHGPQWYASHPGFKRAVPVAQTGGYGAGTMQQQQQPGYGGRQTGAMQQQQQPGYGARQTGGYGARPTARTGGAYGSRGY